MKVIFSTRSKADLRAIADWISEDSVPAAKRTVSTLQTRCLDLCRYPLRFPVIGADGPIRRRVVNAYIIFYVVNEDHVQIIRILHGARDYIAILGADDPRP